MPSDAGEIIISVYLPRRGNAVKLSKICDDSVLEKGSEGSKGSRMK